jgi:2-aminoadipate transaminase
MSTLLQVEQINVPQGFIDLGRGDPQLRLLPLDILRRAADVRLSGEDNAFLQYGAERGDGYFRLALAEFLSAGYESAVDPQNLFITSGISSALDLLCTQYARAGDTVFVEEPSYFLALRIFEDHGLNVVSLPTDESGLVVEALEEALKQHQPRFLYVVPVFQNPTGHTLTEERRQRLLTLAKQRDLLIIADEVYQFLPYSSQPPRSFGAHSDDPRVVSLGSFSKILAPGLRLGWLQAQPAIIDRLAGSGLLDSGGGMNPFASAIVRSVIESGDLQEHIAMLRKTYAERVRAMDAALKRHLPQSSFVSPEGGYFFWLRLPGADLEALRPRARMHQVDFRPGWLFSSRGGFRDYLRLSISFYEAGEIEQGVQRLAESLGVR